LTGFELVRTFSAKTWGMRQGSKYALANPVIPIIKKRCILHPFFYGPGMNNKYKVVDFIARCVPQMSLVPITMLNVLNLW